VFIPQSKYNVKSDVVGIFKTSTLDYVVLCVQANDWFTDIIRDGRVRDRYVPLNVIESWKKFQSFPAQIQTLDENQNRLVTITPLNLLLTTNALTIETKELIKTNAPLTASEGIGSVQEMTGWLPTAAYACQLGETLRSIFAPVKLLRNTQE